MTEARVMAQWRRAVGPLTAALAAAALGGPVEAQEYDPAAYRAACARAAARAGGPPGDPATIAALGAAVACGADARWREPMAAVWAAAPADEAALRALAHATGRVGGERLLRAALRVAEDPRRPADVRVYALLPLVSYVDPRAAVGALEVMRDTARSGSLGSIDHPSYSASSSIDPALRDTVRARLRPLAEGDPDPLVRHAARVLFQHFTATHERWNPYARQRCAQLAAAYRAAPDSTARSVEFSFVLLCAETGGELLAAEWRRAGVGRADPADSARLRVLPFLSTRARDLRVLRAAQAAAEDPRRPVAVRLAALHTVATLADPTLLSAAFAVQQDRELRQCPRGPSWPPHHHAVQEQGGVRFGSDTPAAVRTFLDRQATDPNARVRRVAAFLRGCLRSFPPTDGTPPGPE